MALREHVVDPHLLRLIEAAARDTDKDELRRLGAAVNALMDGRTAYVGAVIAAGILHAVDAKAGNDDICALCLVRAIIARAEALAPEVVDTIGAPEGSA